MDRNDEIGRSDGMDTVQMPPTIKTIPRYPEMGNLSPKIKALQMAAKIGAEPREIG